MATIPAPPRGVLRPDRSEGWFEHLRRAPPDELSAFVEHFWTVAWRDVTTPLVREVLSHPSVHLVFERPRSDIAGVPTGRFVRRIEGEGRAVGVKFRPGCFRPFVDFAVSRLTDRVVPIDDVFGRDGARLARTVCDETTFDTVVDHAIAFLRARGTARDPRADETALLVQHALDDRAIRSVEDLARHAGIGVRTLQRRFDEYVGVSPKWVIRRYRLHDAIERMDAGTVIDWASLAHELGYFDQAHFIRDFRRLVGRTPARYQPLPRPSSKR